MVFLWIALTLACGVVVGLNLSLPNLHMRFASWPKIWHVSMVSMCLAVYHYTRANFDLPWTLPQVTVTFIVTLVMVSICFIQPESVLRYVFLLHSTGIILVITSLSLFISRWRISSWVCRLHVPILSLAAGAGLNDFIFYVIDPKWAIVPRGGFGLFIIVVGIFAAMFHRLATTLQRYEHLNQTMRFTIERRTAELAATQAHIAKIEKQRAIDAERERIMFDLHDGVGGQLVNIMAYLENQGSQDRNLITSLEDAVRDLALIIDSLEEVNYLEALLASLKSRLDPIFDGRARSLEWDCKVLPKIPNQDASKCLNAIRVIQEAITNALNHTNASRIRVWSDETGIRVSDNGKEVAAGAASKTNWGSHTGLGMRGMQRRATEIGARVEFDVTFSGTELRLLWHI